MWLSEEPSDSPTCWAAISVPSGSGVITGMNAPCLALREMMPASMISIPVAIPAWYPAIEPAELAKMQRHANPSV